MALVLALLTIGMVVPPGEPISNTLTGVITVRPEETPSPPSGGHPSPSGLPLTAGLVAFVATPESGGVGKMGELTLDVPAGAVRGGTTFEISPAPLGLRPTRGTVRIMGLEYVITATDANGNLVWEFDRPLSLSLPIPPDAKPEDLIISYWDETLGEWVAVPTEIVGGRLIGSLAHLTVFAVLEWPGLSRFTDLVGHWAESDIVALSSLGIVNGYDDDTYRPETQLTRAEAVKLIVTGLDVPSAPNVVAVFADEVPLWARPYVEAAMKAGVVTGYEDGTFRADSPVSRAEWVLMLMRAGHWTAESRAEFGDALPAWAADSIGIAGALGLVTGYPDHTFHPLELLTRGEAAATVYRAIHLP